jgi:uncharacterized protein (DUF1015 family)
MAVVKPFRGLRPPANLASEIACLPYDVMNSDEAARMAEGREKSLLHITRSEIDLPKDTDLHSEEVYGKDQEPHFYIYAQTMKGRTQYGIAGAASVDDYLSGVIKKHELTRPDKEEDRMIHVRANNANIEPVLFAYPAVKELNRIVERIVKKDTPEYDFVSDDGIGHHFWVVWDTKANAAIEEIFSNRVPFVYVADGHHRTAAAALVGKEKRGKNHNHRGDEEYNYFLAVLFPDDQLRILDYNRLVKDLNGMTPDQFIERLKESFKVVEKGTKAYKPVKPHNFGMYLGGKWYSLTAFKDAYNEADPIGVLDVTILTEKVLVLLLDIQDLRRSKRIDFVGGIRGLAEMQRRVDSGEMKVAFALFPVSMQQLITIADTGNIMPPKTTWFEPKLRSGLVIHKLD